MPIHELTTSTPKPPLPEEPTVPSARWRAMSSTPKPPKPLRGLDAAYTAIEGRVRRLVPRRRRCLRFAEQVLSLRSEYEPLSDDQLRAAVQRFQEKFRRNRDETADMVHALAVISEASARALRMRPYREQLAGAFAIHQNCIAEMATGEGKTLVAGVAATLAGWRGRGCHVITVNDYLAGRDAELMSPLFEFCGLSVAAINDQMSPEQRGEAYAADVTYCTNKDVAADFLRDRLILGRQRDLASALLSQMGEPEVDRMQRVSMRGLAYAIVDEADSVLIDEAVTPLIISGEHENAEQAAAYEQAAAIARDLIEQRDYNVDRARRDVTLTGRGRRRGDEKCEKLGGIWTGRRRRYEMITQAVQVRELFLRGQQYIVRDEKVVIVDEFTGRLMPDRTWRAGLHQAVEAKEGLKVQPPKQTLARISFQRFFQLYDNLGGMTGTAAEASGELWQTYRLPVVPIPTHRPCRRKMAPDRICRDADQRWQAVVEEIQQVHATGRSVLVGTRSVEASEHLSSLLGKAGLEHRVLNAVRHEQEAQVVAEAGQPGRITVATNMAGRGTDIKLHDKVAERGGLHVIATERHESGRVDRQLFGRCARQGDPGSAVAIVSCEDELLRRYAPRWVTALLRLRAEAGTGSAMSRTLFKYVQRRAQAAAARQRRSVVRSDEWLDEQLGFAGAEL